MDLCLKAIHQISTDQCSGNIIENAKRNIGKGEIYVHSEFLGSFLLTLWPQTYQSTKYSKQVLEIYSILVYDKPCMHMKRK